ncbi:hypothetical protein CesoFtcFv8_013704 [Champsocephalus esox]|uniref:Cortactin-binding protein-2 N-terminal domain-containing protein n=1 Tax=Champsocephalus esox TaxID=159716 RepID=A0AAN8BRW8_9TELE|nr:hypothetical protein CesoFtcFv8_013704 [Champsocephalus esox]
MVSWNQNHLKKHNSESPIQPMQSPKLTVQRASKRDERERLEARHKKEDLSRDDLLFLLSILEGELQARDEVIAVLKSEKTDSALLGAQYGSSRPEKVLRALQRDSLWTQQDHLQDVYKETRAELNNLVKAQKRSSEGMQEQLLEVSRSHKEALHRLEEQERSRRDFTHKSTGLTTLLEEDRERLKLLVAKEREYQEIKDTKVSERAAGGAEAPGQRTDRHH